MLSKEQAQTITHLEGDYRALEEVTAERLRLSEERHREALERLTERLNVDKKEAVLAVREEYQARLEKANAEGNEKLRELYEQIRVLQAAAVQQSQSKPAKE